MYRIVAPKNWQCYIVPIQDSLSTFRRHLIVKRHTPLCFLLLATLLLASCSSYVDISNSQSHFQNTNYSQAFLDLEQPSS